MRKELLKGLTDEQIKKVEACNSSEEVLALAKAEGYELSEEQLEAVSGGGCGGGKEKCDECGSENIKEYEEGKNTVYQCKDCGNKWSYKSFL